MLLAIVLLPCFLFSSLVLAADFTGRVVGIFDGDTISVMHGTRVKGSGLTALIALRSGKRSASEPSSSCASFLLARL
jgi:hypothetical protein